MENKDVMKRNVANGIFIISLLYLFFNTLQSTNVGYAIGSTIKILVIWSVFLGPIAYLIWWVGFKKRQGLFFVIFAWLFFMSAIFDFVGDVYRGYVMSTVNTPEFKEELRKNLEKNR